MTYQVKSTVEDVDLVEKRRGQIVTAATKLFATNGFFRTTIKDIAGLAGISQGLIYQYVTDKEDVLLLVLLDVLDGYARELPAAFEGITDPFGRAIAAIRAYARVVDRRRKATILAYRSTQSLSENRRAIIQNRELETNQIIGTLLSECLAAGVIRPVNVDILTYQIVMMAHSWALKHWYFKSRFTLEQYVEHNIDLLFHGVLTETGKARWEGLRKPAQA